MLLRQECCPDGAAQAASAYGDFDRDIIKRRFALGGGSEGSSRKWEKATVSGGSFPNLDSRQRERFCAAAAALGRLLGGADDGAARLAALVALVVPPPPSPPNFGDEDEDEDEESMALDNVAADVAQLGFHRTMSRVAPLALEGMLERRLSEAARASVPGMRAAGSNGGAEEMRVARTVLRDVARMLQGMMK